MANPENPYPDESALNRRDFLKAASIPCLAVACAGAYRVSSSEVPPLAGNDSQFVVEASFYEKLSFKKIKCRLCPRECVIDDRERGYCGVRENRGGTYYTLVHSRVAASNVDPIEKKPFFHFLPGSSAFSIATAGCNVNCKMCQNWQISQVRPEQIQATYLPPDQVAGLAGQFKCPVIAYTYTEPVVFCEYMLDTAAAGHRAGLKSVMVTGGYVQQEVLKQLCHSVDAIKVDLKGFSEKFYREVVNGELKPVLDTLVTIRKQGIWLEVVQLVLPTLNDSDEEIRGLARWIKAELGQEVPIHFSRFHPEYLLKNLPPTPVSTLERAKAIADAEGLRFAYVGNVPGHPAESTYCPRCRQVVVQRNGFVSVTVFLEKGKCRHCQTPIAGVWSA
ncbi:MAG: AmmeMemoRadiSam system radical SAM enzyme [Acidobacteriia bacterium]|nr:AmmeMemoRadiSam system radical SAM enzyme [Terriglobia bacterium]